MDDCAAFVDPLERCSRPSASRAAIGNSTASTAFTFAILSARTIKQEHVVRTILLAAVALAVVAFSLPADARVHHRVWGAYGSGYWGTHGPYWSPYYRGRDIPLKDRFF